MTSQDLGGHSSAKHTDALSNSPLGIRFLSFEEMESVDAKLANCDSLPNPFDAEVLQRGREILYELRREDQKERLSKRQWYGLLRGLRQWHQLRR